MSYLSLKAESVAECSGAQVACQHWEARLGGSLQAWGQPDPYNELQDSQGYHSKRFCFTKPKGKQTNKKAHELFLFIFVLYDKCSDCEMVKIFSTWKYIKLVSKWKCENHFCMPTNFNINCFQRVRVIFWELFLKKILQSILTFQRYI